MIHIEHLEDTLFTNDNPIETLMNLMSLIYSKNRAEKLSVKVDGSMSIVFNIDKENGLTFVATKSYFNKSDKKICRSISDIRKFHEKHPDIVNKLTRAYIYLGEVDIEGTFQADFLFDDTTTRNDGQTFKFTPNVVTYMVPSKEVYNKILGVNIHTRLVDGKPFQIFEDIKSTENVYCYQPKVIKFHQQPQSLTDTFSSVTSAINRIGTIYTDGTIDLLREYLLMFVNDCVRNGQNVCYSNFKLFLHRRESEEFSKKRSDKGRELNLDKFKKIFDVVGKHALELNALFYTHVLLTFIKEDILSGTSIDGLVEGQHEGLVYYGPQIVKLVNRYEFSRRNFQKHA